MTLNQCLTDGGLPDGWTRQNLLWLAKTHRHHANHPWKTHIGRDRAAWHHRWATFIEDVLESHSGKDH